MFNKGNINLTKELNLEKIDRIIIHTLAFIKDRPKIEIEIIDRNIISTILEGLSCIEDKTAIDSWCQYRLDFFQNGKIIVKLELYDSEEMCFLRYKDNEKGILDDYLPKAELCGLLHFLIQK